MCGIFGYVGEPIDIGSTILDALRTLEYRGYDSWGVAVAVNGQIAVEKQPGKIAGATVDFPPSGLGFGHTRWATHGGVTAENAHPHLDCSGRIAVIHNGIVENFRRLRSELELRGHRFLSDTDSEVIAHLIEEELVHARRDVETALTRAFARLDGLNAVIAMDILTREMVACKNVSPLVVGDGPKGSVIASDAVALRGFVNRVHYIEDNQVVRLGRFGFTVRDRWTMADVPRQYQRLSFDSAETGLNGHADFMSKEMAEQPAVLERLAADGEEEIRQLADAIADSYGTFLIGCGTASYAALTGAYLFSRIASRHVNFVVGSEFKYHEHFLTPKSLVVALSQSGETADVVEAMMAARRRGARLGALVNVRHSTLDRMVDLGVHVNAGPEQCVLSTKAYTAKVAALLLTAHALQGSYEAGRRAVLEAAAGLRELLSESWTARVRALAEEIHRADSLFVIGRGLAYPTALEAALKIKEVSYIHAEGFAGGELKHGVIALISAGTPCVVYAPCDETRTDILSGAMELKSRGGYIIGIGPASDPVFDVHLPTPDVGDASPLVNALPAQMLGYHAARLRGNDPDKPRNLAKSVTVK
ncbi:MAG: glutamine--fructose-6-phosphate transaminase (isomerizing) [Thermomicrobiales bacterium]